MDIQKFTQKSADTIREAEGLAAEYKNPTVDVIHIITALFKDREGLIFELAKSMGADGEKILSKLQELIAALPKISGDGQLYLSWEAASLIEGAEKERDKIGDEFTSVEHIMLAFFETNDRKTKDVLTKSGFERRSFLDALKKIRGNKKSDESKSRKFI